MVESIKEKVKHCEHDVNLTEEHWLGDDTALIFVICCNCGSKFSGLITKN